MFVLHKFTVIYVFYINLRKMSREKDPKKISRKCPVCLEKFKVDSERSLAIYCSNACKQQAYLARKSEQEAQKTSE
ncbi:MAG: hypothetical protein FMNOHCHN_03022 [Ignavibacteriaceae bacterium]|nr:hypothetical protein [Ignavibacteriaceae bacterium]